MFLRFAVAFPEYSENLRLIRGGKKGSLKIKNTSPKLSIILFIFPSGPQAFILVYRLIVACDTTQALCSKFVIPSYRLSKSSELTRPSSVSSAIDNNRALLCTCSRQLTSELLLPSSVSSTINDGALLCSCSQRDTYLIVSAIMNYIR